MEGPLWRAFHPTGGARGLLALEGLHVALDERRAATVGAGPDREVVVPSAGAPVVGSRRERHRSVGDATRATDHHVAVRAGLARDRRRVELEAGALVLVVEMASGRALVETDVEVELRVLCCEPAVALDVLRGL